MRSSHMRETLLRVLQAGELGYQWILSFLSLQRAEMACPVRVYAMHVYRCIQCPVSQCQ